MQRNTRLYTSYTATSGQVSDRQGVPDYRLCSW